MATVLVGAFEEYGIGAFVRVPQQDKRRRSARSLRPWTSMPFRDHLDEVVGTDPVITGHWFKDELVYALTSAQFWFPEPGDRYPPD